MPSISDLLRYYKAHQIKVPILSRVGGGIEDLDTMEAARIAYERSRPNPTGGDLPPGPDLEAYDDEKGLPFYSSNVESAYFNSYNPSLPAGSARGDLYIKFQARKGDKPDGEPRGSPRAYVYQNVPGFLWEALLHANSPGGTVWDLIRHGGIPGDPID